MEFTELKAGRQTDRLVAETLGYQVRQGELYRPDGSLKPRYGYLGGVAWELVPSFSRDVQEAIQLLQMTGRRWSLTYNIDYGLNKFTGYDVTIDGIAFWNHRADTPALAICKSWLYWKKHEDY